MGAVLGEPRIVKLLLASQSVGVADHVLRPSVVEYAADRTIVAPPPRRRQSGCERPAHRVRPRSRIGRRLTAKPRASATTDDRSRHAARRPARARRRHGRRLPHPLLVGRRRRDRCAHLVLGRALALASVALLLVLARGAIGALPRAAKVALAGFALYVAWSYLSIDLGALRRASRWRARDRTLLYLLVFTLMAALPWSAGEPRCSCSAPTPPGIGVIAVAASVPVLAGRPRQQPCSSRGAW